MTNPISNIDNTIDSRDVIERIEELEAERETLLEIYDEFDEFDEFGKEDNSKERIEARDALTKFDNSEEGQELTALKKLAEQGENIDDWQYGVGLIHEDYFETVMDDMVANCYTLPKDLPSWMTITYDYDALKQDYTEIDFDGQTYYVR